MRKAFTMIELVFVIVIIGILASIAMPKFMVTRDDAKIVSILANVKGAVKDVKNAYANNPALVEDRQDWYGGAYNDANNNGGCMSVFTHVLYNRMQVYVSKKTDQNSCDLNDANRDELFRRAEKVLHIKWGKRILTNGTEEDLGNGWTYYYVEDLSGLAME